MEEVQCEVRNAHCFKFNNSNKAQESDIPDFAVRKEYDGTVPCPCCNLPVHLDRHQVVGEVPRRPPSWNQNTASLRDSLGSLFTEGGGECSDDIDEAGRMIPGVLGRGVAYTVREVIAQGYIHKKGSGYDWCGSRAWKARWAVLVVSFQSLRLVDRSLLPSTNC